MAKLIIGAALATAALGATVAWAQAEEAIVGQARAAGQVGEQADGYLGFVTSPSAELKAAVDAINIKRRAIYTDIAAKQGATVQEVAAARGCDQLAKRVGPGQFYKVGGSWARRDGSAPVPLPAVCG
ncbi:YdbL family protein [Sphingomonas sp. 1P06PA]|uniref:YdbL family protein n=1 Tax=Sphingomonas sp. 1P06PA TaxID=554121 RepID=UPI0039A4A6C4